jgi:hypothetical protein
MTAPTKNEQLYVCISCGTYVTSGRNVIAVRLAKQFLFFENCRSLLVIFGVRSRDEI